MAATVGGRAPEARDLAQRACGSTWFLFLAAMVVRDWPAAHGFDWPVMLSRGALVLVYLTLSLMVLVRPAPVGRASGLMPNAMAFIGTYMPWLMSLMPRHDTGAALHLAATTLILCGSILTFVVVLWLGRSFSLVPQARSLVTTGPYALIRHPLYLMEELMIGGTALLYLSPLTVTVLVLHSIVQLRRMSYEEAVLTGAFPEYRDYMARTWRVVPYVW